MRQVGPDSHRRRHEALRAGQVLGCAAQGAKPAEEGEDLVGTCAGQGKIRGCLFLRGPFWLVLKRKPNRTPKNMFWRSQTMTRPYVSTTSPCLVLFLKPKGFGHEQLNLVQKWVSLVWKPSIELPEVSIYLTALARWAK